MSEELARVGTLPGVDFNEMMGWCEVLASSGYFQDAREASQAVVKVLAGRELGFDPIASMTGIQIIKGRVSIGANLLASAVKRSGRYNYLVKEMTDERCEIAFFEKGKQIGTSAFTSADAKRAETGNMGKFPRNMLFARAMSNGVRWFCPDVGSGAPLYTPDELGQVVDEGGSVIDLQATEVVPEDAEPTAEPKPATNGNRYRSLMAAMQGRSIDLTDAGRPVRLYVIGDLLNKQIHSFGDLTDDDVNVATRLIKNIQPADLQPIMDRAAKATRPDPTALPIDVDETKPVGGPAH